MKSNPQMAWVSQSMLKIMYRKARNDRKMFEIMRKRGLLQYK